VQDIRIPCSPAKNELYDDERKPISLVPKTEEATNPMPMVVKPNSIWNPLVRGQPMLVATSSAGLAPI
jgi:hypothetical protein